MARCVAKRMRDTQIIPRPIGKVEEGGFYVPDCPDYEPRIDIPTKVRMDEILTGWHCRNCKNFKMD